MKKEESVFCGTRHGHAECGDCRETLPQSDRLKWALEVCEKIGIRLTPVREKLLGFLSTQHLPVSLNSVLREPGLSGLCDSTTAYRTLVLLHEADVLRRVVLPGKSSYFALNVPDENHHFLICRSCGTVTELPPGDQCEQLAHEIAVKHGYTQIYHELQFFGICPDCRAQPRTIPTKLPISRAKNKR